MEAEIRAGAKIEFLTREELKETLADWRVQLGIGVKFPLFTASATIGAGGTWQIGGPGTPADDYIGPREGFVWAIMRAAISGPGFDPTANDTAVFIDEASPSRRVAGKDAIAGGDGTYRWEKTQLVLSGGQALVFTGAGTAASSVTVSGQAIELPAQQAWQLV